MKDDKKKARIRRAIRTRSKLYRLGVTRLLVHRTSRHIYAQVISPNCSSTLVTASTLEKDISKELKHTSNKDAASLIGKIIAERSLENGIQNVSFDRSGFRYHGRIQALAESARKFGLNF